ncbi:hypothetical protein ACFOD4_09935 [Pseudoroseomonas globiformis]|uniref:DUF2188 domain-containing protein n=1 Tax=Teichococcus globiformis TaxID=2307229 RepID=A0ABV7G565_9PROT
MAYRELRYYRSHPLEVRECGDSGWAVHVYSAKGQDRPHKMAVVSSPSPGGLTDLMRRARAVVDAEGEGGGAISHPVEPRARA